VVLIATPLARAVESKAETTDVHIIAIVLGKKITIDKKGELNRLVLGALLQQYAKENKLEPSDEELDAFFLRTEKTEKQYQDKIQADRVKLVEELKDSSLSDRDREQKASYLNNIESILKTAREMNEKMKGREEEVRSMKRPMAQHIVKFWKTNKALYEKYGGRVIYQQGGVEPIDAYRNFLREQEKNAAFQFLDKKCEADFWDYFTNDTLHVFATKEEGVKLINTPWWMIEESPKE
jgi:hypothetical protein